MIPKYPERSSNFNASLISNSDHSNLLDETKDKGDARKSVKPSSTIEKYLKNQKEMVKRQKQSGSSTKTQSLRKKSKNFFDENDSSTYRPSESSSFTRRKAAKRTRYQALPHNFSEDGDVISDIEVHQRKTKLQNWSVQALKILAIVRLATKWTSRT